MMYERPVVVKRPNFDIIKENEACYFGRLLLPSVWRWDKFDKWLCRQCRSIQRSLLQIPFSSRIRRPELTLKIDKALTRIYFCDNPHPGFIDGDVVQNNFDEEEDNIPDQGEMFLQHVGNLIEPYHSPTLGTKTFFNKVRFTLSILRQHWFRASKHLLGELLQESPSKPNTLLKAALTGMSALLIVNY